MKKKSLLLSFCITSFVILFSTVFMAPKYIIILLDLFFYIGIIMLLIGSVLLIIQDGFFTRFINNSRRFYSTLSKREQVIQDVEGKNGENPSYLKQFPLLAYILPLGAFYFSLSLIGSLITVQLGR
ncbi:MULTISPECIES: DUF3899 domain-containing protein [Sporosarcina]|jgi:hypothetical protein|uniref:DUF3899 domain-containing protein n=1 Tax=Sporosarcina TaxID=1569 RepID=UPI00078E0264|nr:DUF3899 domain-containing protein [Sporosarcina psychrophila]AMQ06998.1 hypothetical protein AZE41_14250 [Sporosarcina psychrophila]